MVLLVFLWQKNSKKENKFHLEIFPVWAVQISHYPGEQYKAIMALLFFHADLLEVNTHI